MVETEVFYKAILDNLYDGVYFVDRDRRITYWNKGAERISGYQQANVLGSFCFNNILMHIDGKGQALCNSACPLVQTILDGQERQVDVFLHHTSGQRVPVTVRVSPIRDAEGQIQGAVEVFSDNSSKLAALEKVNELQRDAFLDSLTGIGNRRYTELRLQSSLDEFKQQGLPFGIIFADIDHFKRVNDTFGHDTGDRALIMVAQTTARNLQSFDFLGRWGGDELLAILPNTNAQRLETFAKTVRQLIAGSHLPGIDGLHPLTLSAGATMVQPNDTAASLVKRADRLLYLSKQAGRNRVTCG